MEKLKWFCFYFSILLGVLFNLGYMDIDSNAEYFVYIDKTIREFNQSYIDDLIEFNEDMPRPCRTDLCNAVSVETLRKGTFHWKDTLVAHRVKMRCPFAIDQPVYIERSCVLGEDGRPVWQNVTTDVCPDPPVAQLLHTLKQEYDGLVTLEWRSNTLLRIQATLQRHVDKPMNDTEVQMLLNFTLDVIPHFQLQNKRFSGDIAVAFLTIFDTLLSANIVRDFATSVVSSSNQASQLMEQLRILPITVETGSSFDNTELHLDHFILSKHTMSSSAQQHIHLNIAHAFQLTSVNNTYTSHQVEIQLPGAAAGLSEVGVVLVKDMSLLYSGGFTPRNTSPAHTRDLLATYDPVGSLVLVSTALENMDNWDSNNVQVKYDMDCTTDTCLEFSPALDDMTCVMAAPGDVWRQGSCQLTTSRSGERPQCACSGIGAFGILFYHKTQLTIWVHKEHDDDRKTKVEISSFLGFPYHKELDILGEILNAISLTCLVATLLSYTFIRKARRGSSTTILLNLCVALICLSVALFTVQLFVHSKTGCRIANILRYYLVFVTLAWNTVEAVNMYLMLIKVLGAQISKFALKAGVLAWGIPGLMVAVSLAVNKKIFNGQYVVLVEYSEFSGDCAFKCQLCDRMLYFGYILPLCLIILHNTIIFMLVLRVILGRSQIAIQKKRSRLVQLTGIAATLVLLGIPWIFSAFGVLDPTNNRGLQIMEAMFQVIFVVFINLQGLFIFVFHCARNANIRERWSSALSTATNRTTTSSSGKRNSSTHSHTNGSNSKSRDSSSTPAEKMQMLPKQDT